MLIAGPNLTLDRTLTIDELRPGEVMRFREAVVTPGGKGVNVARVARALAAPALLVSFLPGRTGQAVAQLIADEQLSLLGVPTTGEVRAAIVVLEASGRVSVMNEPGPRIAEDDWTAYELTVAARLPSHGLLVCSGSVPPGSPTDAYARLVALARKRRIPTLVDAAGATLEAALEAVPDFVTPNFVEAEEILLGERTAEANVGREEAKRRALVVARKLVGKVRVGIVTAGAAGVAVAAAEGVTWLDAPRVFVRNPVGAGDSFVGGLAAALERGEPVRTAVAWGVATAAASVETPVAGGIDAGRADELAGEIAPV